MDHLYKMEDLVIYRANILDVPSSNYTFYM